MLLRALAVAMLLLAIVTASVAWFAQLCWRHPVWTVSLAFILALLLGYSSMPPYCYEAPQSPACIEQSEWDG